MYWGQQKISNLKPHLRSKIVAKHLLMMIRESIFKEVGAKICLEEVITDLKDLEENGILFKGKTVPVTVEFMLGDSLGQHLIGGFIESFSGEFMCRFCVITRQDMKADPLITKEPRTIADYNRCALRAMLTGSHCKGIKATCELNQLKYFHASSHLVPCVAHDCYEGAFSWDMAGIISGFVEKKWFSYKLLNKRIKKFKCVGVDSTNKPAFVPSDGEKLGGHAVQNWTMIRLFYFIIGDKIQNFEDDGWLLYLKLKELSEYFCAPSFKKIDVPYIQDVLLPSYFHLRRTVLPKVEIRPKHHFVAHYPGLMLKYGPLIYIWTLPFEQKHKFFKELMRNTKNFINPEFTCAERQQMYFCLTSLDPMFPDENIESRREDLSANSLSGDLSVFISSLNLIGWSSFPSVVANNGINYKCKDVLILLANDEMSLSIGTLKVIVSKGSHLNFILEVKDANYIAAIGNYEIDLDSSGNFVMVSADSLKYPVPQPVYPIRGKMLFSLKHKILI
ncbi:Acyl-[acyl-carrier-protein]--UDP-N-acetylglucosamine O-acyltransferase [Frankliniella fusca]|uniref:Acyl-[acyl-carrier-protein]--UDP-N-acetylglucosamine O-acyltransferase n=1 Tax=Frankliniella fusca TaxID=407009 RepID=A0AAE1HGP1_9NEOP|nr:Acyl-[acyl-carrier-protein]--UDP-N-acetylglucosamine O-acyltransferase [Frankliniella fusca]